MLLALVIAGALLGVIIAGLGAMLAFGTGSPPPPLASIGKPFESVDFSDLPPVETIPARRGSPIAFRHWGEPDASDGQHPPTIIIAIHGSSAMSSSLHPLAKALRTEGLTVYAPDIRGHGDTGRRGDIDYAGQLDDDFADLVAAVQARHTNARLVLLGFSSGGGFALHVAALPLGRVFDRAVLISPMLGIRAPTIKLDGNAWATAFIPRIIALSLLNRVGIHWFDHLPVLAFAIDPRQANILTGAYSFALMNAFATADYVADLRNASAPFSVVVGESDELFYADQFAPAVAAVRADVPVALVPGLNHIAMITDPRAVPAIVHAVRGGRSE